MLFLLPFHDRFILHLQKNHCEATILCTHASHLWDHCIFFSCRLLLFLIFSCFYINIHFALSSVALLNLTFFVLFCAFYLVHFIQKFHVRACVRACVCVCLVLIKYVSECICIPKIHFCLCLYVFNSKRKCNCNQYYS